MAICGETPFTEALKLAFPAPSSPPPDSADSLDENIGKLGLQEGDGKEGEPDQDDGEGKRDNVIRRPHFPLRPGEPDCAFYLRTGACKYGANCRFNHPPRRRSQEKNNEKDKTQEIDKNEIPEQTEPAECKYYLTAGGCKFGKACKYSHTKEKSATEDSVELNFLGLPIRLGEKECPFYMKNGSCKFASHCKFHHPDPTAVGDSNQNDVTLPFQPPVAPWNMQTPSSQPLPPYLGVHPPYVPLMFPHPPGASINSEWNGYPAQASSVISPDWNIRPQPSVTALVNINEMGKKADASTSQHRQTTVEEFPERPGESECHYYMKTGTCKFRSACRYHHPKIRPQKPSCALNPSGLPLRPGQIVCAHYSRYGICKFGPACKFDHPVTDSSAISTRTSSSSPSAESLDKSLDSSEPAEPACQNTSEELAEASA